MLIVYTTRGKCSVYYASRVIVFFEKSFRVPKIVPKVYYQELLVSSIICCKVVVYQTAKSCQRREKSTNLYKF